MALLLVEVGLFHRNLYTGDCDVARFIQVEIGGYPCVLILLHPFHHEKKFNCVLSKAQRKSGVLIFCFILKLTALEPAGGC